jgi:SWI/SNF-related matrix-associated actin-dependent regulator of chromatin subfamily A-like protein 1
MNSTIYHKTILKTAILTQNKKGERVIKIKFPFNMEELTRVRTLFGRYYIQDGKFWEAPLNINNLQMLNDWGYVFDKNLEKYFQKRVKSQISDIKPIEIPGLNGALRPFQNTGVSLIEYFIDLNGRGALLGDEMGLGKTIQALAYLQLHKDLRPAIIVVPASLKLNWEREALKWLNPKPSIQVLSGSNFKIKLNSEIIILNYDIIANQYETIIDPEGKEHEKELKGTGWVDYLIDIKPKILIADECHYIKNSSAQRTKGVKKLANKTKIFLALSGTPIENRPIEIFNSVNLIDPNIFNNEWAFKQKYCGAKHNGFGWNFLGASNTKELHNVLIHNCMIRRLKKDVLSELPEKIYSFIPLEIDNEKEYRFAENNFIEFIKNKVGKEFDNDINNVKTKLKSELGAFMEKYNIDEIDFGQHSLSIDETKNNFIETKIQKVSTAEVITQIEILKQLAAKGKINQIINWIENFLESDEKLVVFARHKFIIDILMQKFNKIAKKIDGSVSMDKRQLAIDSFQNDLKTKLIIISEAGGVGITLTAASNIAITENPWTPGKLDQIVDRVHRIGQKNSVNVHQLIAINTIDESIAKLLDEKRKILSAVLDGKEVDTGNLLYELIKQFKNKE